MTMWQFGSIFCAFMLALLFYEILRQVREEMQTTTVDLMKFFWAFALIIAIAIFLGHALGLIKFVLVVTFIKKGA